MEVKITASEVRIDEELFRRILDNLVSNAVAHGAVGRPINISLYNENDNLVLDVANRGKQCHWDGFRVINCCRLRSTDAW